MSDTIVPFPGPFRGPAVVELDKRRAELEQDRQKLLGRVRKASFDKNEKFERREDRIRVAQEIDYLIKKGNIKPRHIREVLKKNRLPDLHLERLHFDHDVSPDKARKQGSKGLMLPIQPYVWLLDTLAEILGQQPDDLIAAAFRNTSFANSGNITEVGPADDLNWLLNEMIRGVIKAERLEEYFKSAQTALASYDPATETFLPGIGSPIGPTYQLENGEWHFGYEGHGELSWDAPPFPAVPLIRVQRMKLGGPLHFEKIRLAPSAASANEVARRMTNDCRSLKNGKVEWSTKPFGPTSIVDCEITICTDVRLVIGPKTRADDLGPMLEIRSFVELSSGGSRCELTMPFSVTALAEPNKEYSEIECYVGYAAARLDDGWHRVTGLSPETWPGMAEIACNFGTGLDAGPQVEPLVENFGGGHEFAVSWLPLNGTTVAQLIEIFGRYLPDYRHFSYPEKLSAKCLFNTEGPHSGPEVHSFAHWGCQDLETALHTGALEEALGADCKHLYDSLEKVIQESDRVRERQKDALLARWRSMDREP